MVVDDKDAKYLIDQSSHLISPHPTIYLYLFGLDQYQSYLFHSFSYTLFRSSPLANIDRDRYSHHFPLHSYILLVYRITRIIFHVWYVHLLSLRMFDANSDRDRYSHTCLH